MSFKKPRRNAILIRSLAQQASEMANMMDFDNINNKCVSSNYFSSEVPKDKPFSFSAVENNESSSLMEQRLTSLTFQRCITTMSPEEK
jgi:hypothetical protein